MTHALPKAFLADLKRDREIHGRYIPPPLTAEDVAALQAFAADHGRRWKSALRDAWMSGGNEPGTGGILRTLRNTHGYGWLIDYRLPKA